MPTTDREGEILSSIKKFPCKSPVQKRNQRLVYPRLSVKKEMRVSPSTITTKLSFMRMQARCRRDSCAFGLSHSRMEIQSHVNSGIAESRIGSKAHSIHTLPASLFQHTRSPFTTIPLPQQTPTPSKTSPAQASSPTPVSTNQDPA